MDPNKQAKPERPLPPGYYVARTSDTDPSLKDGEVVYQEMPLLPHMVKRDKWESPGQILMKGKASSICELLLKNPHWSLADIARELDMPYQTVRNIMSGRAFRERFDREWDARCQVSVGLAWQHVEAVMQNQSQDKETLNRKDNMARFVINRSDKLLRTVRKKSPDQKSSATQLASMLMDMARTRASESGQRVSVAMEVTADPGDAQAVENLKDLIEEDFGVKDSDLLG